MIDLGVLPGDSCANAYVVNSRGQVVGTSENEADCLIPTGEHAFLWENGGRMVDLNSLIAPGSSLELTFAFAINGNGEMVGTGVPSGCAPENVEFCGHAYVLIPCDENHPGIDGCDYSLVDASAMLPSRPAFRAALPQSPDAAPSWRNHRFPSFTAVSAQGTRPQSEIKKPKSEPSRVGQGRRLAFSLHAAPGCCG